MARSLRWRNLIGGLVGLAAIVVLSVVILVFGNVNSLHGKTARLYAAVGSARGVLKGTEVWLHGRRVGMVDRVDFQPPTVDTLRRLVIVMNVLEEYRPFIRDDAQVQIRPGGSLIGAPVVYVDAGSPNGSVVASGDTIRATPQRDIESMASEFTIAARDLPAILANVKLIGQQLRSTSGTLGALGIERGGPALDATQARLTSLGTQLQSSNGTIGRALRTSPTLAQRAQLVLARADSVRRTIRSERTALQRDSTLLREVQSVRDEMAIVRALMQSPHGNLGRFGADSAIFQALTTTQREMGLLFQDLRRRPLRYVHY